MFWGIRFPFYFLRILPYTLINFQQKFLVFIRMDSETLKLAQYFGEPSVFLPNKEDLWKCDRESQFSTLPVYLALLIFSFHPTWLAVLKVWSCAELRIGRNIFWRSIPDWQSFFFKSIMLDFAIYISLSTSKYLATNANSKSHTFVPKILHNYIHRKKKSWKDSRKNSWKYVVVQSIHR